MYKLIKILNTGINVPEPMRFCFENAVHVSSDMPVIIKNGTLTPVTDKSTSLPTHIAMRDSDQNEVLCYAISPDMVFEAALSETAEDMKIGNEYLLSSDGSRVSATAVSGSLRGAVLMNKNGACNANDTVLISFR